MKETGARAFIASARKNTRSGVYQGISFRSLSAAAVCALTARIYYLMAVDYPQAANAAWVSPLIGFLFALPIVLIACNIAGKSGYPLSKAAENTFGKEAVRLFYAVFALLFTYETACMFRILTGSAEYATLYNTGTARLLIPTGILILLVAVRGGNGIGGAAMVWMRLFPLFYAVILIMEIPTASFSWMFPILGEGIDTIVSGGVLCASYLSFLPSVYLIGDGSFVDGKNKRREPKARHMIYMLLLICVLSSLLLLIHCFLFPHIPSLYNNRSMQLDMLLSNGKSNLGVQLPILIVWFSALAFANAFFLYAAGRFLQMASGKENAIAVMACAVFALLLSIQKLSMKDGAMLFAGFVYYPIAAFFLVFLIIHLIRRKRRNKP